jgi:hypothetical protein
MTMNVSGVGEQVCWRSHIVYSSPSFIPAAHCKALRISLSTFHPSSKLSLDSWNVGSGFDTNNSM